MESGTRLFLTLCNCLRNSARSNNFCVFQSNESRGERRVSRIPCPIIPRDLAKRVKFLANCGLIKPPYWTVATCQNTLLALEPISRIVSHHQRHRITASMIAYSAILRNALLQSSDSTKTASASDRKAYPAKHYHHQSDAGSKNAPLILRDCQISYLNFRGFEVGI